jgi:hypothetical protein
MEDIHEKIFWSTPTYQGSLWWIMGILIVLIAFLMLFKPLLLLESLEIKVGTFALRHKSKWNSRLY